MDELFKNKKIKEELDRIKIYFEDLDESKKAVVKPLLQNAAFMKVTLEDLQELINSEGVIDTYQNGANQSGTKQSATLQSYNSLIKNYASVIKTLYGLLPYRSKVKPLEVHIKTDEELEAERLADEERHKKIDEEIRAAAEYQRKHREERKAKGLN